MWAWYRSFLTYNLKELTDAENKQIDTENLKYYLIDVSTLLTEVKI